MKKVFRQTAIAGLFVAGLLALSSSAYAVDADAAKALAKQCVAIGKRYHSSVAVTASVGGFVPKVQTPFQWFGQNTIEELTRKVYLLRDAARPVCPVCWAAIYSTARGNIASHFDGTREVCPASGHTYAIAVRRPWA